MQSVSDNESPDKEYLMGDRAQVDSGKFRLYFGRVEFDMFERRKMKVKTAIRHLIDLPEYKRWEVSTRINREGANTKDPFEAASLLLRKSYAYQILRGRRTGRGREYEISSLAITLLTKSESWEFRPVAGFRGYVDAREGMVYQDFEKKVIEFVSVVSYGGKLSNSLQENVGYLKVDPIDESVRVVLVGHTQGENSEQYNWVIQVVQFAPQEAEFCLNLRRSNLTDEQRLSRVLRRSEERHFTGNDKQPIDGYFFLGCNVLIYASKAPTPHPGYYRWKKNNRKRILASGFSFGPAGDYPKPVLFE